jgi:hypothetical protein
MVWGEQPGQYPWNRGMGYILFPLTPALSLGERKNRPPFRVHNQDRVCQASVRKTHSWQMLFPLPEGEGQGEGKRRFASHRVSTPQ